MSTTYNVQAGDTFKSISRKRYGTETNASLIQQANPGTLEPLAVGISLVVPDLNSRAPVNPTGRAETIDEVALSIAGERFRFWNSMRITSAIDAVDTIELSAPFDYEAPGFRDTFKPFSYTPISLDIGGDALFTGAMVAVNPLLEESRKTLNVSGYSFPGVLNDCTLPISAYPAEFNNLGLRDIASQLARPFGINVAFDAPQGAIFERVSIKPGNRVMSFLGDLAKQRNLVVSSTREGRLQFLQSAQAGNPVARLTQGSSPLISVTPLFSPQEYYSHVSGIEPVVVGREGSNITVRNPRLKGITRPLTFTASDTLGGDLKTAVEAKVGRMYGAMASYQVKLVGWRDPQGELWKKNTTVTLDAPDAMVYQEYEFEIRNVTFDVREDSRTTTLNLVIPGAYSGKIPETLPWD